MFQVDIPPTTHAPVLTSPVKTLTKITVSMTPQKQVGSVPSLNEATQIWELTNFIQVIF